MIYSLFTYIFSYLYPSRSSNTSLGVFSTTFLINILVSLVMLPINIRLAAQLIMQVFKYRYIVKHVAILDYDNQVMTGYYQHFQTIMCIILCMVGFNVFNVLSAVYFLAYIYKSDWGDQLWFRWILEGVCFAFQECIILFAVSMLHQIACYFRRKKFTFVIITIVILLRFLFVAVQTGIVDNLIFRSWAHISMSTHEWIISPLIFGIIETIIRVPMVITVIRVTQKEVSNYIKKFREDLNTEYLDEMHYADKINAGKLLQIAGWGTISVSILSSISILFQYIVIFAIWLESIVSLIYFIYSVDPIHNILNPVYSMVYSALIFILLILIQIITMLPSILYLIFLIVLWLYFRSKTRVKYSGYSTNDLSAIKLMEKRMKNKELFTNQDSLHHTYYAHKNNIIFASYVIIIVVISLIFSISSYPLFNEKWKEIIRLKQGDYYQINGSKLNSMDCPNSQIYTEILENRDLTQVYVNKSINCSENIYIANYTEPRQIEHNIYRRNTVSTISTYINTSSPLFQIWIPKNSTLFASTYRKKNTLELIFKTDFPCYFISSGRIYDGQYGINYCQTTERNNKSIWYASDCQAYNKNTKVKCTIKFSGMYSIRSDYLIHAKYNVINWADLPIIIYQFGYKINDSTLEKIQSNISINTFQSYDVILLKSSENITH